MAERNPDWLQDFEAQIAAEDPADRRAEAERRRKGLPEPKREIRVFEGFPDSGATPRE